MHDLIDNDWLLGGILIVFWGNIISTIDVSKNKIDSLRKWSAITLTNGTLRVIIVTIHRISTSNQNYICSLLV